jgi:hypothetical protein
LEAEAGIITKELRDFSQGGRVLNGWLQREIVSDAKPVLLKNTVDQKLAQTLTRKALRPIRRFGIGDQNGNSS